MTPTLRSTVALAGALMALSACTSASTGTSASSQASAGSAVAEPSITIGAFNFTESQILAELYAGVLRNAGYEVGITQSTNREVLEPALEAGEVQVIPEYLGTFTEFLNLKVNGPDAAAVASGDLAATLAAGQGLAGPLGITLLTPSPAADQNAFAVTAGFAQANALATLSDLAAYSQDNDVRLGGPPECPKRPFCQPGLEGTYGMRIAEFMPLDAGGPLTKQAIDQGTVDVGLVFSSDGAVADLDLTVLADDKSLQQVDNVTPAVVTSAVTPELTAALDGLSAVLTTADLVAMNKAVDIDRSAAADVAAAFLTDKGLA